MENKALESEILYVLFICRKEDLLYTLFFIFLYKIDLFINIINLLKQLFGNYYNQCCFRNRAPTQHYIARTPATSHELDMLRSEVRCLVRNKI